MTCKCYECLTHPIRRSIAEKLDHGELAYFLDLYEAYQCESTDATYWKCKYEGTWPGDDEDESDFTI